MSDTEQIAVVNSGEPYDVYDGYADLYYNLRDTKIENAKLEEKVEVQYALILKMLTSLTSLRHQADDLEERVQGQAETIGKYQHENINLEFAVERRDEYITRIKNRGLIDRLLNREPREDRFRKEYGIAL